MHANWPKIDKTRLDECKTTNELMCRVDLGGLIQNIFWEILSLPEDREVKAGASTAMRGKHTFPLPADSGTEKDVCLGTQSSVRPPSTAACLVHPGGRGRVLRPLASRHRRHTSAKARPAGSR